MTLAVLPAPHPKINDLRRFFSKVFVDSVSGCWLWVGAKNSHGYGLFYWKPLSLKGSHRIAYRWFVSNEIDGLVIDHLCRNKDCVNPAHLEAVLQCVNVMRDVEARGLTMHCMRGHALVTGNVYSQRNYNKIRTYCLTCRAIRNDRRRRKHQLARLAVA